MAQTTVLYDADCGFCKWSLAKLLAWDRRRRLRPVRLQDPEADALLGYMETDRKMASWHVVTNDGSVHSGGGAFAPVLRALPRGRRLAALAEAAPTLTDHAYRLVAGNRSRLGRWVADTSAARAHACIERRQAQASPATSDEATSVV